MSTVELTTVPSLPAIYSAAARGAATRKLTRTAAAPGTLPDTRYRLRGVVPPAHRLTDYQHLVGEPAADRLPACFVHVLSFPVAMALMASREFPLPLMGMVHLSNRIDQFAPIVLGESIDFDVHASDLAAHHRGTEVRITASASVSGEVRWRGESMYLAKGVFLGGTGRLETGARPEFTPPEPTGSWNLPADIGRRYAAVSGDFNPIHLSSVSARALGFKRAIAHGMYLSARAVAATGVRSWDSMTQTVSFGSPALIPGRVALAAGAPLDPPSDWPSTGGSAPDGEYVGWNAKYGRRHFSGAVWRGTAGRSSAGNTAP